MAVDASLSRQLLKALKNAAQLSEIERLLQAGAHPHYSKVAGFSSLHVAAFRGRADALALLLSHHEVQIDLRDSAGLTPLMTAARFHKPDCVRLLLDRGANPKLTSFTGFRAIDFALETLSNDIKSRALVVAMLIGAGGASLNHVVPLQLFGIDPPVSHNQSSAEAEETKQKPKERSPEQIAEEEKKLGNAYFQQKKFAQAAHHYTNAIRHAPKNHVLYSNRAAAFNEQKKFAEAKADAEKCIQLKSDFIKGYFRLASACLGLGDVEGARKALTTALAINPNEPELLALQAQLPK